MDGVFTRGTVAIDTEGVVRDTRLSADGAIKVTVVIARGALGDFTSFEHQKIWRAYQAAQSRIDAIVATKCDGLPVQSCEIAIDKADLETAP